MTYEFLTDAERVQRIGKESKVTYVHKWRTGFFDRYMSGRGLDVGFKGGNQNAVPILESATGVDIDTPGYDGHTLPFESDSFDYVYSSHCLEHVTRPMHTIKEWHRVVRVGGHIVIVVPHQYLYEKRLNMPSRFSTQHLRFYTPGSLLVAVEAALKPNTYRVRFLEDGDRGFDYSIPPEKHSVGQYEVTLVLQKIKAPEWSIE